MADNLFDDVEAILDAEMSEDKNFNDSELQDIMAEIEDLEKEFISEEAPAEMSLQEKIDAELAMELEAEAMAEDTIEETIEETAEVFESVARPVAPVAEVLAFEKAAPAAPKTVAPMATSIPTTTSTSTSQVAFSAQGSMALNLDFKVGSESAKLTIDPVKGLIVTVSGVELCISEDSGCTVSMENGMKFTIPLSSQNNSHTKKAA